MSDQGKRVVTVEDPVCYGTLIEELYARYKDYPGAKVVYIAIEDDACVQYDRLETDEEYEQRLKEEKAAEERARHKAIADKRKQQLAEARTKAVAKKRYDSLKAKWGFE